MISDVNSEKLEQRESLDKYLQVLKLLFVVIHQSGTDLISSVEVQEKHSAEPDCVSSGSSPTMKLSGSSLKCWGTFCE